jgi:hypothetical protein
VTAITLQSNQRLEGGAMSLGYRFRALKNW